MKKLALLAIVLLFVGAFFVPAVSAENIVLNDTPIEYLDVSTSVTQPEHWQSYTYSYPINSIYFHQIERYDDVSYISIDIAGRKHNSGVFTATYTLGSRQDTAVIYVDHYRNLAGVITATRFTIFPQNWDSSLVTGPKAMVFSDFTFYTCDGARNDATFTKPAIGVGSGNNPVATQASEPKAKVSVTAVSVWKNGLTVVKDGLVYRIDLTRVFGNSVYGSTITLKKSATTVFENGDIDNKRFVYNTNDITQILLNSGTTTYTYPLNTTSQDPSDSHTVTIYVQSSQTGALISPADLAINEYGTENWINSTLEWGWTTVDLPVGNFEFYATADGFTQPYPGRLTVDGVDDNIVLLLNPTGPTPAAGNVTLEIWANYGIGTSANRYSVPGAEVSITGVTGEGADFSSGILTCNEFGRVDVEVPGNTTYSMYASAPGYISYSSSFTVTTGTPVHISASLVQGALPTNPTVPATPIITQTLAPEETPGTSFVEQSAAAFATFLGTTYAIGKAALGVIISTAVGYTTAKQLRGGAAEFGIGLLGGAVLTTVIGLLPVQMFVVLFIGVGALLGYQYMGGGGGR